MVTNTVIKLEKTEGTQAGSSFGMRSLDAFPQPTVTTSQDLVPSKELQLSMVFSSNANEKQIADSVNHWLKQEGLSPLTGDEQPDKEKPLIIGFKLKGLSLGGEISTKGHFRSFEVKDWKILCLDYGESSNGGPNIDILLIRKNGDTFFINRTYSKNNDKEEFISLDDYLALDGPEGQFQFRLQKTDQSVFAGSLNMGLDKISAPKELISLCNSLKIR